uniref:Uncharacterized protein n=1 Tax=Bracon brevicornis TaxID=1563983 RepID=A0A6V7M0T2_9HYME
MIIRLFRIGLSAIRWLREELRGVRIIGLDWELENIKRHLLINGLWPFSNHSNRIFFSTYIPLTLSWFPMLKIFTLKLEGKTIHQFVTVILGLFSLFFSFVWKKSSNVTEEMFYLMGIQWDYFHHLTEEMKEVIIEFTKRTKRVCKMWLIMGVLTTVGK